MTQGELESRIQVLLAGTVAEEMIFEDISEYRVPPPETMFLHRKLVGCFMLCARLGARVEVQKLISPFLPAG